MRTRKWPVPSDSIDEDDDEDPLANPSPRGISRNYRASSMIQPPAPPPLRLNRPNPLEDVRSGSVALPRPDNENLTARNGQTPSNPAGPQPGVNILSTQPSRSNSSHASGNDIRAGSRPAGTQSQMDRRSPFSGQGSPQAEPSSAATLDHIPPPPNRQDKSRPGPSSGSEDAASDVTEEESIISMSVDAFLKFFRIDRWPKWFRNGLQVISIIMFLSWLWLFCLELFMPANRWEGVRVGKNYTNYGMTFWRQNIAQIVPWIVLHPFALLTGNLDYADFRNTLHWLEINSQNNKIRLDFLADATYQMRRVLPELIAIKIDPVSNHWSIEDSFWHAMDNQAKQGNLMNTLLTLEKSDDGIYKISDPHWDAIRQRIENTGGLVSGLPAPGDSEHVMSDQVTAYVDRYISQAWANWLKENADAINRVTRGDTPDPSPHHHDLYGDVQKAVSQRLKDLGLEEQVVTKDEFIEEIKHQSNQYAAQIRTEMDTIQDKLGRALEIAEAAKAAADAPSGMSRSEMRQMIDEAVQRSITDAQLEAIAKGNIKSHLDTNLLRRKNYFSTIRGAMIDPVLTSSSFGYANKITAQGDTSSRGWALWSTGKKKVFRDGGKDAGVTYSPGMALERWEEDGECWCAGLGGGGGGKNASTMADLSILTADTIVPQHLVVEHIAPSGSFDPEATPKDIEVWIRAPTDKRRRTLEHWSTQRWPEARRGGAPPAGGTHLPDRGFVKVGEFRYDSAAGKGETQVFRLSGDLLQYDAQTRQVLVRAKTNYGAPDHTCFYRLRLFGEEGQGRDHDVLE